MARGGRCLFYLIRRAIPSHFWRWAMKRNQLNKVVITFVSLGFLVLGLAGISRADCQPPSGDPNIVANGMGGYDVYPVGDSNRSETHPRVAEITDGTVIVAAGTKPLPFAPFFPFADVTVGNPLSDGMCTPDVHNVQWAVDNSCDQGVINLMDEDLDGNSTSFNFGDGQGDADFVGFFDMKELTVQGLKSGNTLLTKIVGGFATFRAYEENDVTIADLHFDNSLWSAVVVATSGSKGWTLRGNKITNTISSGVFPSPLVFQIAGGEVFWIFKAVFGALGFRNVNPQLPGRPMPQPNAFFVDNDYLWVDNIKSIGTVTMVNNEFDLRPDPLTDPQLNSLGQQAGIVAGDLTLEAGKDKKIIIENNLLKNIADTPMDLLGSPGGTFSVVNNTILQRAYDSFDGQGNPTRLAGGIIVRDHIAGPPAPLEITGNRVENAPGPGIFTSGMNDSVLKSNVIADKIFEPGTRNFLGTGIVAGISLLASNNNTIQGNKVTGEGDYGTSLVISNNNVLLADNLYNFDPVGDGHLGTPPNCDPGETDPTEADFCNIPPLPPSHILLLSSNNNAVVGSNNVGVLDLPPGGGNVYSGETHALGLELQEIGGGINAIAGAMPPHIF